MILFLFFLLLFLLFFLCFSSCVFLLSGFCCCALQEKQLQSRFDSGGNASSFFLRARSLCFSSVFFACTHTHTAAHTHAHTDSCRAKMINDQLAVLLLLLLICRGCQQSASHSCRWQQREKKKTRRRSSRMGSRSEEQSKTKSQNFCLEMKFDFNASGCKRSPVTTPEGGMGREKRAGKEDSQLIE